MKISKDRVSRPAFDPDYTGRGLLYANGQFHTRLFVAGYDFAHVTLRAADVLGKVLFCHLQNILDVFSKFHEACVSRVAIWRKEKNNRAQ